MRVTADRASLSLAIAFLLTFTPSAHAQSGSPTVMPLGSLRLAPGAGAYAAPHGAFEFDFDLAAGVRVPVIFQQLFVAPVAELGYSYRGGSQALAGGSYFFVGAGVSFGTPIIAATLVPAYVTGPSSGQTVHGLRTAVRADFFFGVFSLELAHEWRAVRDIDAHSVHMTLALDLGIAVSFLMHWVSGPRARPEEEPEPVPTAPLEVSE